MNSSRPATLLFVSPDSEDRSTPLVVTARHGYFRLRDEGYQQPDIDAWAEAILEHAPQ